MRFNHLSYLPLICLFFSQASCNERKSFDPTLNVSPHKADSIIIYGLGVGTYSDDESETDLTSTYVTPVGLELKELVQKKLVMGRIYKSGEIDSLYKRLIQDFTDEKHYVAGTDNRLALIFFRSGEPEDTLSIINKNQALLNNKSLITYNYNIVEYIISMGIHIPAAIKEN